MLQDSFYKQLSDYTRNPNSSYQDTVLFFNVPNLPSEDYKHLEP